jgi:hypothetical protein
MKEQIEAVQRYFKDKILAGNFDVERIRQFAIYLKVDGVYSFVIWIGNFIDIKDSVKNHENELSFMDLKFTKEESIQLSEVIKPYVMGFLKETLIEEKKKELEHLEKQLS